MRKWIVALLTVALALCVAATASAETITCASCGREIDASSAFCPYCGVKVEAGLQITEVYPLPTGQTYIAWTDGLNNGPYTVLYRYFVDEDYDSPAQQAQIFWQNGDGVTDCSTVCGLAPGDDYWIIIRDSQKNEARYVYRAPEAAPFQDVPVSVKAWPLTGPENDCQKAPSLLADDINTGKRDYGLYLAIETGDHDDMEFSFMVVLRDPNGVPIVDHFEMDNQLERGLVIYGWGYFYVRYYFEYVKEQYGQVPLGAYSASIYLNGQSAGEALFMVR